MKLSEAVRAGAEYRDAYGTTMSVMGDSPCGCAIGCAIYSKTKNDNIPGISRFTLLASIFPIAKALPNCPVCDGHPDLFPTLPRRRSHNSVYCSDVGKPGAAIECLYEVHGWSKKAIAEWVATIEDKLETEQAPGARLGEPSEQRTEACVVGFEGNCTPAEVTTTA